MVALQQLSRECQPAAIHQRDPISSSVVERRPSKAQGRCSGPVHSTVLGTECSPPYHCSGDDKKLSLCASPPSACRSHPYHSGELKSLVQRDLSSKPKPRDPTSDQGSCASISGGAGQRNGLRPSGGSINHHQDVGKNLSGCRKRALQMICSILLSV